MIGQAPIGMCGPYFMLRLRENEYEDWGKDILQELHTLKRFHSHTHNHAKPLTYREHSTPKIYVGSNGRSLQSFGVWAPAVLFW